MNKKDNPNYRLRNINMDDDIFHAMEYIGAHNHRSAAGEMVTAMVGQIKTFRKENNIPDDQVLITAARSAKISKNKAK